MISSPMVVVTKVNSPIGIVLWQLSRFQVLRLYMSMFIIVQRYRFILQTRRLRSYTMYSRRKVRRSSPLSQPDCLDPAARARNDDYSDAQRIKQARYDSYYEYTAEGLQI